MKILTLILPLFADAFAAPDYKSLYIKQPLKVTSIKHSNLNGKLKILGSFWR